MDFIAYPLKFILAYLALLFAPPEAKRISITGPDDEIAVEFEYDGKHWIIAAEGRRVPVAVMGQELVFQRAEGEKRVDLSAYVGAALLHDWKSSAKLTLHDQNTLEKSADGSGYVFRLGDGTPEEKRYVIRYAAASQNADPAPTTTATAPIRLNVLGAVKKPGQYAIPPHSTVIDAIAAAGGFAPTGDRDNASIMRGKAGQTPTIIKVNPVKLSRENLPNPALQDGDTIHVPEIIY